DDGLIAGAAAQVAGQRVGDLLPARVGVVVEQRLGDHDHAGGAVAALDGVLLEEGLLQRVQLISGVQPFEGEHLAARHVFDRQQAGEERLAVNQNGAAPTAALLAARLRRRIAELVAQQGLQRDERLHHHVDVTAIQVKANDLGSHLYASNPASWARARRTTTAVILRRYHSLAIASVNGWHSAAAASAAAWMLCSVRGWPVSAASAPWARIGCGPTALSAMRASATLPSATCTCAAT